jgi:hypothetical protein
MTGFLTRLAARSLAAASAGPETPASLVVPRPVSAFEPASNGAGLVAAPADIEIRELPEEAESVRPAADRDAADGGDAQPADAPRPAEAARGPRAAQAPAARPDAPPEPDAPQPRTPRPTDDRDGASLAAPVEEHASSDAADAAERSAAAPPAAEAPPVQPTPRARRTPAASVAEPGDGEPPRAPGRRGALGRPARATREHTEAERREGRAPEREAERPGALVAARPPLIPTAPNPPQRGRRSNAGEPAVEANPASEPAVHVTIGRVDIRAAHEAAPPRPAPGRAARPPAMSLADYLHHRDSEGRR